MTRLGRTEREGERVLSRGMDVDQGAVLDADVCIVGGGVAGATLALEFAGTGRHIVVLEGGEEDKTPRSTALYEGESVGLPYFELDDCRTRALGGSGACWGGFCRIFDDFDFDHRPDIPHSGWPVSLDALLPYYERAHRRAGLGPVEYDFDSWAERAPWLESPFGAGDIALEILQQSTVTGDSDRDDLRRADDVEVYTAATVTEIETDEAGTHVTALRVRTFSGNEFRVRAHRYVLATGGIENARVLLASDGAKPNGLGNDHDLVGRYFMDHLSYDIGEFAATDPEFHERYFPLWSEVDGTSVKPSAVVDPAIRRREQLLRTFFELSPQTAAHRHGRRSMRYVADQVRRRRPIKNPGHHLRNIWADADHLVDRQLGRRAPGLAARLGRSVDRHSTRLLVSAEPIPDPRSRITLSAERDAMGMRRARLDWQVDRDVHRHVLRSAQIFADEVHQRGLGTVAIADPSAWTLWAHNHHIGTTRMSDDPRTGVVDADLKVHGVDNLHVVGSSVFPTAGAGTVTLLAMVLAIRLGDHLKAQR